MPEDPKEASGHGVRAKRSKSGGHQLDIQGGSLAIVDAGVIIPRRFENTPVDPRPARPRRALGKRRESPPSCSARARERSGDQAWGLCDDTRPLIDRGCRSRRSKVGHRPETVGRGTTSREHPPSNRCLGWQAARPRDGVPFGWARPDLRRRYALFTLVGIAGEDDLDAPDLAVQTVVPAPKSGPPIKGNRSE